MSRPIPTRSARFVLQSAALLVLAACGGTSASEDAADTPAAPLPPRILSALDGPSSWTGELPCGDCVSTTSTVTLEPDGFFRRRDVYNRPMNPADTGAAYVGRWHLNAEGTRITVLSLGDRFIFYAVDSTGGLRALDSEGEEITTGANYTLTPVAQPANADGALFLVGAFTYYADAATFVSCASGVQFPVAMEEAYRTLEAVYSETQPVPGAPLLVRVRGRIADRPRMEGDGTERSLVVDEYLGLTPNAPCASLELPATLDGATYRFTSLGGAPLESLTENTTPTFTWSRADARVSGSSGCNRYTGRGVLRGSMLVASEIAATKRLCMEEAVMERETRVLALLDTGGSLRFDRDTLVVSQGPREVARLVRP